MFQWRLLSPQKVMFQWRLLSPQKVMFNGVYCGNMWRHFFRHYMYLVATFYIFGGNFSRHHMIVILYQVIGAIKFLTIGLKNMWLR